MRLDDRDHPPTTRRHASAGCSPPTVHTCTDPDVRFLVAMDDCRDRTARIVAEHRDDDRRVECVAYPQGSARAG